MREVKLTEADYHAIIDASGIDSFYRPDLHANVPRQWRHKNCYDCPLAQAGYPDTAASHGDVIDTALEVHLGHVHLDHNTPIHVRKA